MRIDQVISNNNRLSFRFGRVPTKGLRFNLGGLIDWVPEDQNTGTNAMLSDTYTWGGNKVNEFHYGFNRSNNSRTQTPQQLAVNGFQIMGFPSYLDRGVPRIQSFGDPNLQNMGSDVGSYEIDNFFEASDTFSWVKGKHT